MSSNNKLAWEAYDRVHQTRAPDWYWAVSIIALSIMVTAILLHNTLFAVFVLISTISLFLRTMQHPRLLSYELTNRGLWTNKSFEPFSTMESYFVTPSDPAKLIIKMKSRLAPLSVIHLDRTDPEKVREFLQEYLEEKEHQESLAKRIMEYLRF